MIVQEVLDHSWSLLWLYAVPMRLLVCDFYFIHFFNCICLAPANKKCEVEDEKCEVEDEDSSSVENVPAEVFFERMKFQGFVRERSGV